MPMVMAASNSQGLNRAAVMILLLPTLGSPRQQHVLSAFGARRIPPYTTGYEAEGRLSTVIWKCLRP
jgi:hypothetical protein